jgi:hypothetical protein
MCHFVLLNSAFRRLGRESQAYGPALQHVVDTCHGVFVQDLWYVGLKKRSASPVPVGTAWSAKADIQISRPRLSLDEILNLRQVVSGFFLASTHWVLQHTLNLECDKALVTMNTHILAKSHNGHNHEITTF